VVERWNQVSLNIKSERTHHLVKELANLTGENLTAAVTIAVQERLDRLRGTSRPSLAERLVSIGRDTAPRLQEPWRSVDHGELLYDERGLPT
jgi:antitoxin VapB